MVHVLGEDGQQLTDLDLVRRCQAGEHDAFGLLMQRHQASVFRLARLLTASSDEAEDVLQQTFLSAWQHIGGYRGDAGLKTWLLTIARHAALARRAQIARQRLDPTPLDDLGLRAGWGGPTPEQQALSGEREHLIARAWARLADDEREILTLRDLEELSGEQAATLLGVSLAAMKSRLHRARLALAVAVKEESHASR